MKAKILNFFKANVIFVIIATIAIISCFIVPIDKQYAGYFDGSGATLTCIFGILIVVAGLHNIDFFTRLRV